jgi:hypothetical protein
MKKQHLLLPLVFAPKDVYVTVIKYIFGSKQTNTLVGINIDYRIRESQTKNEVSIHG